MKSVCHSGELADAMCEINIWVDSTLRKRDYSSDWKWWPTYLTNGKTREEVIKEFRDPPKDSESLQKRREESQIQRWKFLLF